MTDNIFDDMEATLKHLDEQTVELVKNATKPEQEKPKDDSKEQISLLQKIVQRVGDIGKLLSKKVSTQKPSDPSKVQKAPSTNVERNESKRGGLKVSSNGTGLIRNPKTTEKPETLISRLVSKLNDFSKSYGNRNPVAEFGQRVARTAADIYSQRTTPRELPQGSTNLEKTGTRSVAKAATEVVSRRSTPKAPKVGQSPAETGGIPSVAPVAAGEAVEGASVLGGMGAAFAVGAVSAALVVALTATVAAVVSFSKRMIENARYLAQYNGKIAAAFARADIRQFRRDVAKGEAIGGSTANLVNAMEDLKDAVAPLLNKITNLVTNILAGITNWFARLLAFFKPVLDAAGKVIDWVTGGAKNPVPNGPRQLMPAEQLILDLRDRRGRDPLFHWDKP